MAFQQSSITYTQAASRVAEAVGASTTNEINRALYAIQAAFQHWNNKFNWPFLAATASSAVVGGTADYALPTNFKSIYGIKLTTINRQLSYLPRRQYDRAVWNQTAGGDPSHYSLFLAGLDEGKFTLIPTPGSSDTALIRYFRRMTIPPSTGSTAIDIPQDYENYILALSKALYLIDKGADESKWGFWYSHAKEGMEIAKGSDTRIPDEDLVLVPGASITPYPAPADYLYPVE
jgi:hypothetical protein